MVKRGYRAKDVITLTGLSYRQIDYWVIDPTPKGGGLLGITPGRSPF